MWKQVICAALAGLLAANAWADEAALKKAVEIAYPKLKVHSVTKTPFNNLYEVFLGDEIFYTDEKFTFFIVEGRLIDAKTRRNLTADRMEELTRVDFSTLPLGQAIKVVKGNGSRKLVVFSDPDCPYCKQLEQQSLSGLNDVTIYTFLYPLEGLHPDAANKARAIWCAPDRARAWQDWMLNGQLAKGAAGCNAPVDENVELGKKLGVSGTPLLIFSNGKRVSGAIPRQEIESRLAASR
ncbi:putative thiol:disulfide interchange protein DsbC precursor [mine drainage metagenome]|uniref:Putative thiol:disulfide interchange protein DsbC n=1 Tax=mine drainage metagenome TaxID=410659 RepID=A0A1J5QEZ0_9ZZZZ